MAGAGQASLCKVTVTAGTPRSRIKRRGRGGGTGVEVACRDADTSPLGRSRGVATGLRVAAERGEISGIKYIKREKTFDKSRFDLYYERVVREETVKGFIEVKGVKYTIIMGAWENMEIGRAHV